MGSLPNLHELSRTNREPLFLPPSAQARDACANPAPATTATAQSGNSCAVNRIRRVQRTRSTGNPHHLWDDLMMEMASYSPISSRSSRNLALQCSTRRRDSLSSSIGATSVRRLIAVVRNTSGKNGPIYSKQLLIKNYTVLCVGHSMITASLFPLLALQSSISTWYWPHESRMGILEFYVGNNTGSLLLALMYAISTVSSFLTPFFIKKIGANTTLTTCYISFVVFFAAHLFPILYVLIPSYCLMGFAVSIFWVCKLSFLMTVSNKLSCVLTDCDNEDHKMHCRREVVVRRLSRGLQAAQDFGLVIGSLIAALLISYTVVNTSEHSKIAYTYSVSEGFVQTPLNATVELNNATKCPDLPPNNCTQNRNNSKSTNHHVKMRDFYISLSYLDDIFSTDDSGERICGAHACPTYYTIQFNSTHEEREWRDSRAVPQATAGVLAGIFVGFGMLSLAITVVFLEKIRIPPEPSTGLFNNFKESFGDIRLHLSAPLAVFIGLEQAFLYADFTKSYVSCALGPRGICLVFLSLGLLQSVAACTLSMLLRHVKRLVVIVAGFFFHACLLLVLARWKPSAEDSALFYVIAASWGVCNAVWETLTFALLTQTLVSPFAWSHSISCRHLGLCVGFTLHGMLCERYKLLGLTAGLILSVPPYAYLERRCERERNGEDLTSL